MNRYSLNGVWEYRIGYGKWETREVPFSALAVGHSECRRRFDLPGTGERVMLQFEGITYAARVLLNGKCLGEMYPYSEYLFDITDTVLPQDNELTVELEDLAPTFGPSAGWENFGGIIRPVFLLVGARARLGSCFFHADLNTDLTAADYQVEAECEEAKGCRVYVSLLDGAGRVADSYEFSADEDAPVRHFEDPKLWSPDHPHLYRLSVCLMRGEKILDSYETEVGFRSFTRDRHRFYLNGEPLFLMGVCRHEMIGDSGHCPTREAIESELARIKAAGCNFVRLVHYPHGKETLEIAARLGLMVSEEPGLWGSNTANPELAAGSLEVLRRTVLRDRNSPSIVFWLSFNECEFSESYLNEARRIILSLDTTRMISGANDKGDEETYRFFNQCGFDFYTSHPYSDTFTRARNTARALQDKPLVFTEWGGYFVYDNPHLLSDFIREMANLYKHPSDDGALAGAIFWFWREVNDYNRGGPACTDGKLREALIDYNGKPTPIYEPYFRAWEKFLGKIPPEPPYEYRGEREVTGLPLTPQGETHYEELLAKRRADSRGRHGSYIYNCRNYRYDHGPRLQNSGIPGLSDVPYWVKEGSPLVFLGEAAGENLVLIGAVSTGTGYPLTGAYGEEAARLTVFYEDGRQERFPLRNGMEFTTAYTTSASSRIDPHGENVTPFAYYSYDKNHENYILNRLALPLSGGRVVRVEIAEVTPDYDLLFYGAFVE